MKKCRKKIVPRMVTNTLSVHTLTRALEGLGEEKSCHIH